MKKAILITQMVSVPVFLSSFFVVDPKKAVKRRYVALAMFGAAWAAQFLVPGANAKAK